MSGAAPRLHAAVAAWRAAPPDASRAAFLMRVADNAEAIARRDAFLGPPARAAAAERLAALLGREDAFEALEAALADAIRTGAIPYDDPALRDHLHRTALDDLAIDQPGYRHGLRVLEAQPARR